MTTRFESADWVSAMARLVGSDDVTSIADALSEAIDVAVGHEGTCLLMFHRSASPAVLHHTLEPAGRRHYVDRYLAGPYLLDPLYLLAVRDDCPGICRFREASPDRFRSSEYYRQYCERTHLRDEMDFLVRVSADNTLALVVGRRTRRFSKAELARLELIEAIVHAAMRRIWERWSTDEETGANGSSLHQRLTDCFDNFGDGLLTQREREITQLLLRGRSTMSMARELDIAQGPVRVHKRYLFVQLSITSPYERFSLGSDAL